MAENNEIQSMTENNETKNTIENNETKSTTENNETKKETYRTRIKKLNKNQNMKVYDVPLYLISHTHNEWRKNFREISDQEKVILFDSIKRDGLLHPIILWKMEKEDADGHIYEILAGNNRFDIYQQLHQEGEEDKYSSIPAFCYEHDQIDKNRALEIFIDTNYAQRKLKKTEIAYSLNTKIKILKERNTPNALLKAAEDLNIKRTWAYTLTKCTNLIDEFQKLLDEDKITLKMAAKIAHWSDATQQNIYHTFGEDNIKDNLPEKLWRNLPVNTPDEEVISRLKEIKSNPESYNSHLKKTPLNNYSLRQDNNDPEKLILQFNKTELYKLKKLISQEDYKKYTVVNDIKR